ncbi:Spy/CpxP family protein refolding chaperone [Magnetospirillum gryphiswaldense]|uniref:Signal transduction histidine kinase n=1 Tax=Magnetospirillum gryphiswaldense TaxID=55518 RepID=A4U144_9PROT|nr:Spy/CpxP family protein refolding chaperone [Magnetospirillum gryphiswaldense]AVM76027.1 hypothetical protein MSR1_35660 [Magnetospirillum gryphiswaldense MSR-1]AVM79930.1 hypothetical protein MSR1L_35660 [Magnetospirillum gryphiswaldense]CAM76601.1 signal transduction histidine kinase [Magnetospirillum gryphiswaldense MSR-1]
MPRLRAEAETALARASAKPPALSPEQLLHELQVHQVELEMQNDALRQTQAALVQSRDRYLDLYDFAPVGYVTLAKSGVIEELSLTTATLLKTERRDLLLAQFARFVAPKDQVRWQMQLHHAFKHGGKHSCELTLILDDGTTFDAGLDYLRTGSQAERVSRADMMARGKTMNVVENLKFMQGMVDQHSSGLKQLIPQVEALYAVLTPEQKKQADQLLTKHQDGEYRGRYDRK